MAKKYQDLASGIAMGAVFMYLLRRLYESLRVKSSADSLEEDIVNGVEGLIGNTKMVRIKSLSQATGCDILAKAEFLNPGNSPKDRVALQMIRTAEENGDLVPYQSNAVYEGTAGSTGISIAMLCCSLGYDSRIYMPSDQSKEKSDILELLGAHVQRVTPAPIVDPNHFVNTARRNAANHTVDESIPGKGYFANQFENPANWQAHFNSTGPEIWRQCAGKLDAFIAGSGTGGTIAGISRYLKSKDPSITVCLADPPGSGLYHKVLHGVMFDLAEREGTRRRHQVDTIVEGVGINRMTRNFSIAEPLIDMAYRVTDEQAVAMSRYLVTHDGLFVGSSSAVNCVAAVRLAKKLGPGHRIVTLLCDPGSRHFSKLYNEEFLRKKNIVPQVPSSLDFVEA
ncbi:Cysteine synthase Cys12 [Schizosaccharomyces pombe]|uniref:Cysteine synthase 2 n=1 Tax=Schizosaccharomyces pombe (strain 972 / ATCC 24843) TaxID=284812 RepID=CYSKL_SCHPO|nr:cysteine synthase Cys12 [Schizosaccharomyces pombe]P87131.1 RecName: Full=Cysteine synthase 2; Short=CS 2; AltName: Full=Cysteine synthase-like protein; Short=CSl; AltName: Full=O-acetylserine (thiol)-lyase 2; Short=OAS-TL 2; AltName: Full=O-acetylserine sulfhydrylase 2 [Schizosaccharomyces pombe 972h-]CAB08745.1 cysteine synthase Cys12 [Schizosaccharomyces pombe]|eukprot:NP_593343.1 cysteine synthase Cys12 [Schizosaccharomyces pombe]